MYSLMYCRIYVKMNYVLMHYLSELFLNNDEMHIIPACKHKTGMDFPMNN